MGLNIYNIRKWSKMIMGKSILHVNQSLGICFNPNKLEGYFNDLTEKVLKDSSWLYNTDMPQIKDEKDDNVYFPIAIFQYGLGCWDLYLKSNNSLYKNKFLQISDWAIQNQKNNGSWDNFSHIYSNYPYSAMAQGEGISLLLRAAKLTSESKYFDAAKKSLDFMLTPLNKGGVSKYKEGCLFLYEYQHLPLVLNGYIFATFGIYDFWVYTNDYDYYCLFQEATEGIKKTLINFDKGYWSNYDIDKKIASPFYHNLHIYQLLALYIATNDELFNEYYHKWLKYQKNILFKSFAFVVKAIQKIKE